MSLLDGIQTLDDLELENQLVFLRTDLDAPLGKGGTIADDSRIVAAVPTIKKLQELGARIIVGSRFGETKRSIHKKKSAGAPSIEPAAALLSELCDCEVLLPDGCVGDSLKKILLNLRTTQICVLENLVIEEENERPQEAIARELMGHVDVYVADSVRALGQETATTLHLPRLMEFRAAGPNMMKELQSIARIRSGIDGPRVVIWGGSSLSARVDVMTRLCQDAKHVIFVGVAGNTMLRALGGAVGTSTIDDEYLAGARTLAEQLGDKLVLPQDILTGTSPKSTESHVTAANKVPADEMALDIGPLSQARIQDLVKNAGTVIWCGTAGFHKSEVFAEGTRVICESLASTEAFTMIVGDDSVAAIQAVSPDSLQSIDCVAHGGLATLALLDENKLASLEALRGTNHE